MLHLRLCNCFSGTPTDLVSFFVDMSRKLGSKNESYGLMGKLSTYKITPLASKNLNQAGRLRGSVDFISAHQLLIETSGQPEAPQCSSSQLLARKMSFDRPLVKAELREMSSEIHSSADSPDAEIVELEHSASSIPSSGNDSGLGRPPQYGFQAKSLLASPIHIQTHRRASQKRVTSQRRKSSFHRRMSYSRRSSASSSCKERKLLVFHRRPSGSHALSQREDNEIMWTIPDLTCDSSRQPLTDIVPDDWLLADVTPRTMSITGPWSQVGDLGFSSTGEADAFGDNEPFWRRATATNIDPFYDEATPRNFAYSTNLCAEGTFLILWR